MRLPPIITRFMQCPTCRDQEAKICLFPALIAGRTWKRVFPWQTSAFLNGQKVWSRISLQHAFTGQLYLLRAHNLNSMFSCYSTTRECFWIIRASEWPSTVLVACPSQWPMAWGRKSSGKRPALSRRHVEDVLELHFQLPVLFTRETFANQHVIRPCLRKFTRNVSSCFICKHASLCPELAEMDYLSIFFESNR